MTTVQASYRPKVRFITLGCRVNQYETQGMREALQEKGYESTPNGSRRQETSVDLVVINTCTVTAKADRENLYWIRRAKRDHPQARIVVTGCGVERDRKVMESHPAVDLVVSNYDKGKLADRLSENCSHSFQQNKTGFAPLSISQSEGKTRAFVKIQDGCNHACSFCKIVLVRGRSRSRPLQDIVDEVIRLRDAGYRDVVFAGIQLGAYGLDFPGVRKIRVCDVLEACSKIEGIERLRLSSIEPTDVKPSLIQALRDIEPCTHHLHIPLQSGDDEVLARMNRRYDRAFYLELVQTLRRELKDFQLTMDVMAGFPGETEEQFENTLDLLRVVKPLKCHVFPYSRREGVRSARFEDLPVQTIRSRVERMIRESATISESHRTSFLGRVFEVLVEQENQEFMQGLTANYMKVSFSHEGTFSAGQIVPVRLLDLEGEGFRGEIAAF